MSLNSLVASEGVRPLLENVVEFSRPAAASVTGGNGTTSLEVSPAIKIKSTNNSDPLRAIVDALITAGGGVAAEPIADTLNFDSMGLYFVGAGTSRSDEISYRNTRTDPEAPSVYINAREGDDVVDVDAGPLVLDANGNPLQASVDAGEGDDRVRLIAGFINALTGGAGNDMLVSRADTTKLVDGGAGNDEISSFGRVIGTVSGGDGNDSIAVSADIVGEVVGGSGDDSIIVNSKSFTFDASGIPQHEVTRIYAGTGNDTVVIGGEAEVTFNAGDGSDYFNISGTTRFTLGGGLTLDTASITQEGSRVVITFDGVEDAIEIESRTGAIFFEATETGFAVHASEEAYLASTVGLNQLNALSSARTITMSPGDGAISASVEGPTFIQLRDGLTFDEAAIEQDLSSATILFPDPLDSIRLESPTGGIYLSSINSTMLAFFPDLDTLNAWLASPANPDNANSAVRGDPVLAASLAAHERTMMETITWLANSDAT